jgi:hypothetical protein
MTLYAKSLQKGCTHWFQDRWLLVRQAMSALLVDVKRSWDHDYVVKSCDND